MAVLDKKELFTKILDAIAASGWNVQPLTSLNSNPLQIRISNKDIQGNLVTYVWNITHGGKTRSEDEFRIQITGVQSLSFEENSKTLLLGIANVDGNDVFVAFNPFKHKTFGFSPSIQVNKKTLTSAIQEGVAFQEKSRNPRGSVNEIVVAVAPTHFMEYVTEIYPEYHNEENKDIIEQEADLILKNPLNRKFPSGELDKLPSERKRALVKINKAIRDKNFEIGVYLLYQGKCAICELQAKLTEAAHIIAVEDEGSDEFTNGVLLCKNHHGAYDDGLLAIDENYTTKLNNKYVEWLKKNNLGSGLDKFIADSRIGKKIFLPKESKHNPSKDYLKQNIKSKCM